MTLADRIAVFMDGRIAQVGTPREVFARPRTMDGCGLRRHAADEPAAGHVAGGSVTVAGHALPVAQVAAASGATSCSACGPVTCASPRPACPRASSASKTWATAPSSASPQRPAAEAARRPAALGAATATASSWVSRPRPRICSTRKRRPAALNAAEADNTDGCNGQEQAEHRPDPERRHGLFRPRLLRRRDRNAQPRPAGAQGPALLAVLQHRALQPVARLDADRPAPAPDRRRHPDLQFRARRLCRQPEQALRHHSAGAQGQRLQDLHERQVARREQPDQADRHLAAAARLRRVLRHHHRRRQLLRSQHADARQREHRARGQGRPQLLLHRRDQRPGRGLHRQAPPRSSRETPFFTYVAYTAPHWPLHAHDEDIAKYKGRFDKGWDRLREERLGKLVEWGILKNCLEADRPRSDAAAVDRGRAQGLAAALHGGVCGADRPHGPGDRPHPRARWRRTASSTTRCVIFLADNGACAEDIPEDVTVDELVQQADDRQVAHAHAASLCTSATIPRACRARRTRTRATARPGRTSPTRRSASTSTGSTKAASRRR